MLKVYYYKYIIYAILLSPDIRLILMIFFELCAITERQTSISGEDVSLCKKGPSQSVLLNFMSIGRFISEIVNNLILYLFESSF